ncbi:hypothetical protein CBCST_22550 (plasmid) [Clostridium botulinum C str. Stockholm]|nr:hypothetical protein CBCST_22550 [Clostridium botulinum C str. Stockholm]
MNDITKESRVLMKNNIMIKSKYNISAIENRIFQVILYKLQKKNEDILSCEIYHSEFKDFIKNPNQCTINAIYNTLIKLRKSSIFLKTMIDG